MRFAVWPDAQYRRCLTDPVLTQIFGTQGRPGHAEHLAAWLGEVLVGPICTRANWVDMERCYVITRIVRSRKGSASGSSKFFLKPQMKSGSRGTSDSAAVFVSTSNGAVRLRWRYRSQALMSRHMSRCHGGAGNNASRRARTSHTTAAQLNVSDPRCPTNRAG